MYLLAILAFSLKEAAGERFMKEPKNSIVELKKKVLKMGTL